MDGKTEARGLSGQGPRAGLRTEEVSPSFVHSACLMQTVLMQTRLLAQEKDTSSGCQLLDLGLSLWPRMGSVP